MAEKLPTTPDGIICKVCGQDKPAYHYFKHAGNYNQKFFTTELGYTPGVCFGCAGDYRCIECGEIKPASDYRVQGRVCAACKGNRSNRSGMAQIKPVVAGLRGFDANKVSEAIDRDLTPETAASE